MNDNSILYDKKYIYIFGDDYYKRGKYKIEKIFGKFINILSISLGGNHSIFLSECGRMYGYGSNIYGQLGLGKKRKIEKSMRLLMKNIKLVETGNNHTLVYTKNKDLIGFGNNTNGELGMEEKIKYVHSPRFIKKINHIKQICCGENHSLILLENNQIFVCGDNTYGQLGISNKIKKSYKLIYQNTYHNTESIYSGRFHSIIERKKFKKGCMESELIGFGSNKYGQLGLGLSTPKIFKPTKINIYNIRFPVEKPSRQKEKSKIIKFISCGGDHTFFSFVNGNIYSFGWNKHYQLGVSNICNSFTPQYVMNDPNILKISAGRSHNMIYHRSGIISVFGNNKNEQLGVRKIIRKQLNNRILFKNLDILILMKGHIINKNWDPHNHYKFNEKFKKCVFMFLCILKRKQNSLIIPPKYIKYKIINYFI